MFIGHFAVAFAAKPAARSSSLGTLFLACEWVDLVWPAFLLAGLERVAITPGVTAFTPLDFVHYPWAHSLRRTRPMDGSGSWGLWLIALFLVAAYLGAAFGPPPPNVEAIAWVGLIGGALTAALGYWVDGHRTMAV